MKKPHQCLSLAFWALCVAIFSTNLYGEIDDNEDSVSDIWSALYGGNFVPAADPDEDGFSNAEEARAGTDPYNPRSFPKIDELMITGEDDVISCWQSVVGVHYQTLVSGDLVNWIPIGPAIVGTGEEIELEMDPANSYATGAVQRSRWDEDGLSLNKLILYTTNGTPPTKEDRIRELRVPQSSPDENNFGEWIRGYIIAPETGEYVFYVAGDDHIEVRLSATGPPEGKARIMGIPGWTEPNEWDKYPTDQKSSPISLTKDKAYYFEIFHREGSGGDHVHVAWQRPSMAEGTRETIGGEHLSSTGLTLQDIRDDGHKAFLRLQVIQQDSDGDGVSDYEEGVLGLNMSSSTSTPRLNDGVSARQTLASPSKVSLGVSKARAYEESGEVGEFVFFRSGGIGPLSVPYTISGTAQMGEDFTPLSGTIQIPGGARSVTLGIQPIADGILEGAESVTLTIGSGIGYQLGSPLSASVTIDDAADVLYVAQLRPGNESDSGGSGTASVRKLGNNLSSKVGLSFSGLDQSVLLTKIFYSDNGGTGPTVFTYPLGQAAGLDWDFSATDDLTTAEIITALDAGQLWVGIYTENTLEPEVLGQLLPTPAWQMMPAVPTPPTAPAVSASDAEAGRFLTQASFGPNDAEMQVLQGLTYESYLDNQMALPATYHLPMMLARAAEYEASGDDSAGWQKPRNEAWWQHALAAPDQLRQRMAFALSQIVVISQYGGLDGEHEGSTRYYDMLLEHAFGNYRDILGEVTLSPMMGRYLSMSRNKKPDPVTGHEPDENYAREIMQLFSVGLNLMHTDGSLVLDAEGMPIPTYTQDDTVELAHIFTGWGPHYDPLDPPVNSYNGRIMSARDQFNYGRDSIRKMSFLEEFHDTNERTILGGVVISAGNDGPARLEAALDGIFNHQNVGPFMARQLIQKFVTSNPSPGYIYRVASVFNDDGNGVRGNLGATIKAVLLDYEARSATTYASQTFGKPAEPLLRVSRALRSLPLILPNQDTGDSRYFLNTQYHLTEQAPLYSPSVFNFYQPVFSSPGPIAEAGLLSPEFQIFGETNALRQANLNYDLMANGIWLGSVGANSGTLKIDYEPLISMVLNSGTTFEEGYNNLLDYLEDRLLHGKMSPELRDELEYKNTTFPSWFGYSREHTERRAQMAVYIILNSPEYFVQR